MIIIEGKYIIEGKIGEGSFGKLYKGYNANTGKKIAVKMESIHARQLLLNEARVYVSLHKCKGISTLRSFGSYGDFNYIVVDLFERDLEDIVFNQKGRVSTERIYHWGHHVLKILETIHETGIIHRDIKPENIMVSRGKLYLIDFGLSRFYRDHEGEHNSMKTGREIIGTMRYASSNIHDGFSASRRDDLESLAYTLLFLYHKKLPWLKFKDHDSVEQRDAVREMKRMSNICHWCLMEGTPKELLEFLEYAKVIDYHDKPNYDYFKEYKDLKPNSENELLCRSPVSSDKSNGSTTSRDSDSSPVWAMN